MDMVKLLATAIKTESTTPVGPLSSVQAISQIAQAYQAGIDGKRPKSSRTMNQNAYPTEANNKQKERPQLRLLKKVLLHNSTAMCNDGSPAGYYIRRATGGSKRWVVFLEGGWHCFNEKTCHIRWKTNGHFMTSLGWTEQRYERGILSPNMAENPYLWNANHVFVPYCSSDGWSGASMATRQGEFSFMGAVILRKVIEDLIRRGGLLSARLIFLAGSSAGGVGVFLNIDRVADQIREAGSRARVRGIVDSGWFLDNEPYGQAPCRDVHNCNAVTMIQSGLSFWQGMLPERCTQYLSKEEHWKCYFPYRIYPTLKTPSFVVQFVYDEAQMMIDNVANPINPRQWEYAYNNGEKLRQSLANVTALFAPSCVSHTILTKPNWTQIRIRGISLPQALRCWELQPHEHNHHEHHRDHKMYDNIRNVPSTNGKQQQQQRAGARVRRRRTRKNRKGPDRNGRSRRRKTTERSVYSPLLRTEMLQIQPKITSTSDPLQQDAHVQHRWRLHADLCHHRLIDECTWPQCNSRCPPLLNPFTGKQVEFTELLKSFGLDINGAASILGIHVSELYEMSHDALLQILNSQYYPTPNNDNTHSSPYPAYNMHKTSRCVQPGCKRY
ncbi:palmitoleoyl-protein carboxylesterase notum1-like [Varroa jacobsoni]|uniref:palmitoleoyl-protein carboxylesterase notum1-like n=1 Tax=Varroa jacobsoni TaxID=62625 RepID=UPI000BF85031|nr:palmitoleoyl-protein carboxylesterase notum1-like [Varroa jacobsoni]